MSRKYGTEVATMEMQKALWARSNEELHSFAKRKGAESLRTEDSFIETISFMHMGSAFHSKK